MVLLQVDEKHRREMDALARIAACRECGHIGLNKNGTFRSGRSNILLRYMCGNCRKVYSELQLADLLNSGGVQVATTEKMPPSKAKPTRKPKLGKAQSGVVVNFKDLLLEKAEELQSVYEENGGEMLCQVLLECIKQYEATSLPLVEVRLNCPSCGKPMQKTGRSPIRWRCNTKECEFYASRKTQEGWEKLIKKGVTKDV